MSNSEQFQKIVFPSLPRVKKSKINCLTRLRRSDHNYSDNENSNFQNNFKVFKNFRMSTFDEYIRQLKTKHDEELKLKRDDLDVELGKMIKQFFKEI